MLDLFTEQILLSIISHTVDYRYLEVAGKTNTCAGEWKLGVRDDILISKYSASFAMEMVVFKTIVDARYTGFEMAVVRRVGTNFNQLCRLPSSHINKALFY